MWKVAAGRGSKSSAERSSSRRMRRLYLHPIYLVKIYLRASETAPPANLLAPSPERRPSCRSPLLFFEVISSLRAHAEIGKTMGLPTRRAEREIVEELP